MIIKRSLIRYCNLIGISEMLCMILANQRRNLEYCKGGSSFVREVRLVWNLSNLRNLLAWVEFKAVLYNVGGRVESNSDSPPPYMEVVNLGVFYTYFSFYANFQVYHLPIDASKNSNLNKE